MASRAALLEKLMLSMFVGESSTGLRGNTMGDGVVFKGLRLLSRGVEFMLHEWQLGILVNIRSNRKTVLILIWRVGPRLDFFAFSVAALIGVLYL